MFTNLSTVRIETESEAKHRTVQGLGSPDPTFLLGIRGLSNQGYKCLSFVEATNRMVTLLETLVTKSHDPLSIEHAASL